MIKAVYAGSFDLPTLGHLWMIEESARLFDEVVMAIGINPMKRPMFSVEERTGMLKAMTTHLENICIDSFAHQYLINYAASVGCSVMVRGIRNANDYEFERTMRHINADLAPDISTVFLMPPRNIAEVSSSMVKTLIGPPGWQDVVRRFVPEVVLEQLIAMHRQ